MLAPKIETQMLHNLETLEKKMTALTVETPSLHTVMLIA